MKDEGEIIHPSSSILHPSFLLSGEFRMSRYSSWSMLVLGLGLLSPLGCISLRAPGTDVALASKPAEPAAKAPVELPPERAAEACLATAQELEKTGHEADAIAQYEKARQHN